MLRKVSEKKARRVPTEYLSRRTESWAPKKPKSVTSRSVTWQCLGGAKNSSNTFRIVFFRSFFFQTHFHIDFVFFFFFFRGRLRSADGEFKEIPRKFRIPTFFGLPGGEQKPTNRKHINIFLTALAGQSSQGRAPTRPRDIRDKMAILLGGGQTCNN